MKNNLACSGLVLGLILACEVQVEHYRNNPNLTRYTNMIKTPRIALKIFQNKIFMSLNLRKIVENMFILFKIQ